MEQAEGSLGQDSNQAFRARGLMQRNGCSNFVSHNHTMALAHCSESRAAKVLHPTTEDCQLNSLDRNARHLLSWSVLSRIADDHFS
jgi:hypothetical protein